MKLYRDEMTERSHRGELAIEGLEAMPDMVARLETLRRARVADLRCGSGEAGLAIADEFIDVVVDGFDPDPARLEEARRLAADAGLDARVRFQDDATGPAGQGHYDLILALDPKHPLDELSAIWKTLTDDGIVLAARDRDEGAEGLRDAGYATVEELAVEDADRALFRLST